MYLILSYLIYHRNFELPLDCIEMHKHKSAAKNHLKLFGYTINYSSMYMHIDNVPTGCKKNMLATYDKISSIISSVAGSKTEVKLKRRVLR